MSLRPNLPGGDGRRLGVEAMSRLRRKSADVIDDGLSGDEFARIEETFGFRFADDHRAFLAAGLPVNSPARPSERGVAAFSSQPWPDWRHHDHDELRRRLEWPVDGVLFDVENNRFWATSWGKRPDRVEQATEIARQALTQAPAMIPIYGHRYLPACTGTYGHPVLSMWQTDIIYYGLDIADYMDREFADADRPPDGASWNPHATVEFWKDLI